MEHMIRMRGAWLCHLMPACLQLNLHADMSADAESASDVKGSDQSIGEHRRCKYANEQPDHKFCSEHADCWQVYVSPYGAGEWTHMDFQAMICGCLVLKPGAMHFATYPNVFQPGEMVLSANVGWGDLREKILNIFQV